MAKKRLTQNTRNLMVHSIVNDIPSVDYTSVMQDYINKAAHSQLPEVLKAKEVQEYLSETYLGDFRVYVRNVKYALTEEDKNFMRTQAVLRLDQSNERNNIRRNLYALFDSFKYVEDIEAHAPEFVKYIPTEQKPITNLPAVQLTQQLTALGWPKGDEGK